MCGYFGNLHECPAVIDIMNELGIPLPYPKGQHYQRRMVAGLVTDTGDGYQVGEAMWWFALKWQDDKWLVNEKITSFNARNLTSPLWKPALASGRALVFATEIGESMGGKRYLMRAPQGVALAALYRDWRSTTGEVQRSMAIVTRPPHPRFSRYHDKSTPSFLPLDANIIRHWLDPQVQDSEQIQDLLSHARLYEDMQVTPVKSFKRAEPQGDTELLEKDVQ